MYFLDINLFPLMVFVGFLAIYFVVGTIIFCLLRFFLKELIVKKLFNLLKIRTEPEDQVWSASELEEKIRLDSIELRKNKSVKPYTKNWR